MSYLSEGGGEGAKVGHNARGYENITSQVNVLFAQIPRSLLPSETHKTCDCYILGKEDGMKYTCCTDNK
jgi:hypothetical protein